MDAFDVQQLRAGAAAIASDVVRNCRYYRFAAGFCAFTACTQSAMTVLVFYKVGWSLALLDAFTVVMALFLWTAARRRVRQWRRLLFHLQRVMANDFALAWHWESARLVLEELKK